MRGSPSTPGLGGGPNVYAYVHGRPTLAVDPAGLQVGPPKRDPDTWPGLGPGDINVPWLPPKKKSKWQKLCSGVGAVLDFLNNARKVIGNLISPGLGITVPRNAPGVRMIAGIDARRDDEVTRAGAGRRTSLLFSRDVFL